MARATKIKDIHIRFRNGRWAAIWQDSSRRARVVRHADTPEHALISLLAAQPGFHNNAHQRKSVWDLDRWLGNLGLAELRRALVHAKGYGWTNVSKPEAVRVYREWRREQTSGTSLGLGE